MNEENRSGNKPTADSTFSQNMENTNVKVDEIAKGTEIAMGQRSTIYAYHKYEREDELLRLRYFLQCPLFILLVFLALLGLALQRSVGYLCSIDSLHQQKSQSKNEKSFTSNVLRNISELMFFIGIEMEELSLNILHFWLAYWRKVSLTTGGPILAITKLTSAFEVSHEKRY